MTSQRDRESYLEIDHRESPGFTCEEAVGIGLRRIAGQVGKGQVARIPTAKCNHCEAMVILNPGRTRDRERCWKCFCYMCDRCALIHKLDGGECRPFQQVIDKWANDAAKGALSLPT